MPEQVFALDAMGNYVQVYVLDEQNGAWVAINRSGIGSIPSREALKAGQAFTLQDGSILRVQLVENQIQVFRDGQRLTEIPYAVPPQQPYYQPQVYYEYSAPPQVPYGVFPYQQPGYSYATPSEQTARLPLGEAIRQLPGQYIKVVFTKRSAATFAEEQSKASWGSVWLQLMFYALVSAMIVLVDRLITNPISSGPELIFIIIFAIIFVLIVISIYFFITTGIFFLLARAFGGKGTFLAQSYSLLLITVPLGILAVLLSLIPGVGRFTSLAVNGYITLLSVRMIMGVHRLSGGKATAVVLIPLAAIIFIAILIVIIARAA